MVVFIIIHIINNHKYTQLGVCIRGALDYALR